MFFSEGDNLLMHIWQSANFFDVDVLPLRLPCRSEFVLSYNVTNSVLERFMFGMMQRMED